jgi:1,4-alpha-glucan branching enzyme
MWYRGQKKMHAEPVSIYEVHIGSWRQGLTYVELANELVEYVSWQGYTHVEFMPVAQHPFEGSWGYHVTGYFAPMSKFGSPDEFRYLVDKLHQAGIGVMVDWVPGHFATDPWALQRFDGTALYEHEDPRLGWHPDWGSYIFNFGRNEVKSFLISNAYYWLEEFHIDGLRVTASPRCSIWTTPARRASGCRTSTAATRTWRRSSCYSGPIPTLTDASPAA